MSNRFLFYWLPLVSWISGIFVVSSLPSGLYTNKWIIPMDYVHTIVPVDYALHTTAFFVLFVLFYRLFESKDTPLLLRKVVLYSFLFSMTVAIAKECRPRWIDLF